MLNETSLKEISLETDRLVLSPIAEHEVEELHQLWSQPAVRKYLCDNLVIPLDRVKDMVVESIIAFQDNRYGMWVARLKQKQPIIGFTGYWPFFNPPELQLIYGLSQDYWGQGLATEMGRSLLHYGFQTYRFDVISASADVPNLPSIAVMRRLGMTFEKQVVIDGQDLVFYSIKR